MLALVVLLALVGDACNAALIATVDGCSGAGQGGLGGGGRFAPLGLHC